MAQDHTQDLTAQLLDAFKVADRIHAAGSERGMNAKKFIRKALSFISPTQAEAIGGYVITPGKFAQIEDDGGEVFQTITPRSPDKPRFNTTPPMKDPIRAAQAIREKQQAHQDFDDTVEKIENPEPEGKSDADKSEQQADIPGDQSAIKDNSDQENAEAAPDDDYQTDQIIEAAADDGSVTVSDYTIDELRAVYTETSVVNLAKMFKKEQIEEHAGRFGFIMPEDATSVRKKASALKRHIKEQ